MSINLKDMTDQYKAEKYSKAEAKRNFVGSLLMLMFLTLQIS